MNHSKFIGSKWWKIDFHVHTPASNDYGKGDAHIKNKTTEEDILKAAMNESLDAIVIADHNSGEWIDKLKDKYQKICSEGNKPAWFRELVILPAVEITIEGSGNRSHLLAVFDPSYNSANITSALGACGITTGFGDDQNTFSTKSFDDVIKIIKDSGGIPIPAHIDKAKGFLEAQLTITPGVKNTLNNLIAAEFYDSNAFDNVNPELKKEIDKLAILTGSDAHVPNEIGKHFSWIKLCRPTKEELELALIDKDFCVKNQTENPNIVPNIFLKSLEIKEMKYCGRNPDIPFKMTFHPHFNAIIGGRGSGKSTALEAIRITARRVNELEEIPVIKENLDKFMLKGEVVLDNTELILEINRRGKEYRLFWNGNSSGKTLEEKNENGDWIQQEPGSLNERFPLSIYSQKQINELSKNPKGLLEIIDRSSEVDRAEWNKKWQQLKSKFMLLREQLREIKRQLELAPEIQAKLNDVINDLKQYAEQGHGNILKNYQIKIQQANSFPLKDSSIDNLANKINEAANSAEQNDFPELQFQNDLAIDEVKNIYNDTAKELKDIKTKLLDLFNKATEISTKRKNKLEQSNWYKSVVAVHQAYNNLVEEYKKKESNIDLNVYSRWVQQRVQLEQEMERIDNLQKESENIQKETQQIYKQFLELRKELFKKRKSFIGKATEDTSFVEMELIPFGDTSNINLEFRNLLGLDAFSFQSSILDEEDKKGLLYDLFDWQEKAINYKKLPEMITKFKQSIISPPENIYEKFRNKLNTIKKEHPTNFDQLLCWWPEDQSQVKYSHNGQNGKFEDLEKGSAGQKAAAILAFLLSYDDKPLIIDQPEDDLDNALIYNLIVKQIHNSKNKRQLIIVTHNPNIVVNGDAELIHIMEFKQGQIQIEAQGGLGEQNVRSNICRIMEGGIEAFKNRYKRIIAGDKNV